MDKGGLAEMDRWYKRSQGEWNGKKRIKQKWRARGSIRLTTKMQIFLRPLRVA